MALATIICDLISKWRCNWRLVFGSVSTSLKIKFDMYAHFISLEENKKNNCNIIRKPIERIVTVILTLHILLLWNHCVLSLPLSSSLLLLSVCVCFYRILIASNWSSIACLRHYYFVYFHYVFRMIARALCNLAFAINSIFK